jgi:hypothetical protein
MMKKIQAYIDSHDPACEICGASDVVILGSTDSDSINLSMRCLKHGSALKRVFSIGANMKTFGMEEIEMLIDATLAPEWTPRLCPDEFTAAARDDRNWFEANPARKHRVRQAMKGDDYYKSERMMIVRKEASGYSRIPLSEGITLPDSEGWIAAVYGKARKVIGQVAGVPAGYVPKMDVALARLKLTLCFKGVGV